MFCPEKLKDVVEFDFIPSFRIKKKKKKSKNAWNSLLTGFRLLLKISKNAYFFPNNFFKTNI